MNGGSGGVGGSTSTTTGHGGSGIEGQGQKGGNAQCSGVNCSPWIRGGGGGALDLFFVFETSFLESFFFEVGCLDSCFFFEGVLFFLAILKL